MEYKVEKCVVKKATELMNKYAKDGWEVLTVCPNDGLGFGIVITFVKK